MKYIFKNNKMKSIMLTVLSVMLFGCGGGSSLVPSSNFSQLTNASYALTENNQFYVSLTPHVWGKIVTTGIDPKVNYYQLRCGKDFCLTLGNDGSISTSSDLRSWSVINANYLAANTAYYDMLIMANSGKANNRTVIAVGSKGSILVLPVKANGVLQDKFISSAKRFNFSKLTYSNDLYSIAPVSGSGSAVAVGANGSIVVTKDAGSSWVSTTSPTNNNLYAVILSSQRVNIAVGGNGTILTSTDGISWQAQNSGTSSTLLTANYVNGEYVVGGTNNTILVSDDAINWKAATVNLAASIDILQIIRNPDGGLFAFGLPSSSNKALHAKFDQHRNYADAQAQEVFLGSQDGKSWEQMVVNHYIPSEDGLSFNLFGNFFRVSRSANMLNSNIFNILKNIGNDYSDVFEFKKASTN